MAQLDRIAQAAFKKLFGLGHTEVKGFPIGNESDSSAITTIGRDIYTDTIGGSAGAVAGIIVDCTNATDGTATSRLTLTVNPADTAGEGVAYYATVPAGHGLLSEINPNTGSLFIVGERVSTIVPKKFGSTWRPIVYAAGPTEIPPLDVSDWFLDEKAGIVYFGAAPSSTPVRLGCYVYVGKTLSGFSSVTFITQTPSGLFSSEQALSALATGLLKSTTGTGVLSIAVAGVDYQAAGSYLTVPTGTGFAHITAGVGDAAAKLVDTADINDNQVTYAKIQNVTTARLMGRATAGSGDMEEITLGTNLSFTGTTLNAAGGLTDGDKGDITVSGGGATWTIDDGVVTLAKMADMATDSFLGRDTAGTGVPEVLSVATAKTLLGLTGTNSGDQTITLTGDVTGSGTGSFAATIANDAVTLAKMANMATLSVIGRSTAGAGDPEIIDAGSDFQVLRRSGTTLDFGSINMASTNAVTDTLGVGNGGTGTATTFTAGSVIFAGASGIYSQSNADFFWDNTKKFLAIGSTAPAGVVDISKTLDGAGLSGYSFAIGLNIRVTNTPTATQSDRPAHGASIVLVKDGTFAITSAYIPLRALETTIANTGSGAINQAAGNVVQVANAGTGTITEAISYYAYTPTCSAVNAITNIYGFKVENLTVTGVTSGWGFYSAGTSDRNYLAGPLHIRPALAEPGTYSLTSWNGTGQVISLYARGMTANGGTTPNAAEPVLVLARDSTLGVVYGSTVEFKLRRWETGGAPRSSTAMDIALTDGSGPAAGTDLISFLSNGCVGIRTAQPQAALHLPAGTATARTAPLMFTSGPVLSVVAPGAVEFLDFQWYGTILAGARKRFLMADPEAGLTAGRVSYVGTSGRLTDNASFTFDGTDLVVGSVAVESDKINIDGSTFLYADGSADFASTNFQLDSNGRITSQNGVATQGFGVPTIVNNIALTGQVANIASTNFSSGGEAGTYRVGYYMVCTTSGVGAGNISFAIAFNDGTAARALNGTALSLTATGRVTTFSETTADGSLIRLGSGNISYSVTMTGIYSTAVYALYVTLERLS